jgi:hypothetical protein
VKLLAQLGPTASFTQRMLARRLARGLLRLELLDEKMSSGGWTDHDARTFGGLSYAVRLLARELNVEAAPSVAPPSLANVVSRHRKAASP